MINNWSFLKIMFKKIPNFNKIEIINVHLQMINNANYPIVYDFFVVCAKQIITS